MEFRWIEICNLYFPFWHTRCRVKRMMLIHINPRCKVKSVFYSTITLFVLFFVACDFPSPFSGGEQQTDTPQEIVAPGTIFLNVDISGGFAGVQQNLQVDESGNAFFKDSLRPGANWKIQLAPAQLEDIKKIDDRKWFFWIKRLIHW